MNGLKLSHNLVYMTATLLLIISAVQSSAIRSNSEDAIGKQAVDHEKQQIGQETHLKIADQIKKLLELIGDENDDQSNERLNSAAASELYYPEYLAKRYAPKRIFIGRDNLFDNDSNEPEADSIEEDGVNIEKRNSRRHLFLGKRSMVERKRNGQIHRIFIGKRGEIKRIFIG